MIGKIFARPGNWIVSTCNLDLMEVILEGWQDYNLFMGFSEEGERLTQKSHGLYPALCQQWRWAGADIVGAAALAGGRRLC